MLPLLTETALAALLLTAAWRDVATRTIPDEIPALILLFGLAARAPAGMGPMAWSLATALLLLAALLLVAAQGWLGGGDVKLAAAMAVALPPAATWDFITVTLLAGGLLGAGYLAGPRLAPRLAPARARPVPRRILAVETRRLRQGGPLPYAVAIAAGGLLVLAGGA